MNNKCSWHPSSVGPSLSNSTNPIKNAFLKTWEKLGSILTAEGGVVGKYKGRDEGGRINNIKDV